MQKFGRDTARDHWSFNVEIQPSDKTLVRKYFKEELTFYNTLVHNFGTRLRTLPEALTDMTGINEELFGALAFNSLNVRKIKNISDLPTNMEKFKNIFFDENNKRKLVSERLLMTLETAGTLASIHPTVKRDMALEVLKFYREQARSLAISKRSEQVYNAPAEVLEPLEFTQKKNLQIPRTAISSIIYNKDNDETSFMIPYAKSAINVKGDFTGNNWNLVILKQGPDLTPDATWILDIRNASANYLIKYIDHSFKKKNNYTRTREGLNTSGTKFL